MLVANLLLWLLSDARSVITLDLHLLHLLLVNGILLPGRYLSAAPGRLRLLNVMDRRLSSGHDGLLVDGLFVDILFLGLSTDLLCHRCLLHEGFLGNNW